MSNHTLSWQAPEFKHYSKNYAWYVTLIAVSILIVGFFAIERDFFAAITIAIMAVLLALFARHKPEVIIVQLSPRGVHFGNLMYPYKTIKHFWIVEDTNHRTVNFQTTALLNNLLILELMEQDAETIRQYLIQHLPEHQETDATVPQKIMHKLKF